MEAQGNGDPLRCAINLMQLRAGEVPYDRVRGIDPEVTDAPIEDAGYIAEVEVTLEQYEPRVELDASEIEEGDEAGSIIQAIELSEVEDQEAEEDE